MLGTCFDCYLIGGNTLLIECGEILLQKGHNIYGVITATRRLMDWARDRAIPIINPKSDYSGFLEQRPFDFLFSITHLATIPERVLALPIRAAINFHDGPLPHYAGLNTPAWALMNGETEYGITWHKMNVRLDQGDILKRVRFPIEPEETALSLNTRCFEHAIRSFASLVDALSEGAVQAQPQDLSGYAYFGRHDRPTAACHLDWRQDADHLDRLVRALNFGPYENPLGLAKVLFKGSAFMIKTVATRDMSGTPGTVIAADESEIVVATGNRALAIREFMGFDGKPISVKQWFANHSARPGDRFEALSPETAARLTELNQKLAKSESFWLRRLGRAQPAIDPFITASPAGDRTAVAALPLTVPTQFLQGLDSEDTALSLIAAFGALLARAGGNDRFDLAFFDGPALEPYADLEPWIAMRVPLPFQIDTDTSLKTIQARTGRVLVRGQKRLTWLKDLPARFPKLHAKPYLVNGFHSAIAVAITDEPASFQPNANEMLTLALSPAGSRVTLIVRNKSTISNTGERIRNYFQVFLANLAKEPDQSIFQIDFISEEERQRVLTTWRQTRVAYPSDATVHGLFEAQALRTPTRTATVFAGQSLSYAELDQRADRIAARLVAMGIGPNQIVALHLPRSNDMLAAMLAVLKVGGAYLPLDPAYPKERTAFILRDANVAAVLAQTTLDAPNDQIATLLLGDTRFEEGAESRPRVAGASERLAYLIYTSGSTGTPKGVMVTHRNVVNFFTAMDLVIPHDPPGSWLAVTSLSFDISVLELLWTLTRGFKVVIQDEARFGAMRRQAVSRRPMAFGLFYFSSNAATDSQEKYRLLLEGARFADSHGFNAVWTPERHFHDFGGLYPEPSVTGAAVAAITQNVQIRAGSVVLPLHHPIRVAETWSVVDNISGGRVAVSFASGWQPNDFVLRPENYKNAKEAMFRDIELVKKLWRGETVAFPGATGEPVPVQTYPRPIQAELPIWVTTAGNPETYRMAGEIGANVLTHLLGQTAEDLAPKIQVYRDARKAHGHDPESGVVSLMLHTFVGPDENEVRQRVRDPLKQYLGTSLNLLKKYAWAFPAFTKPKGAENDPGDEFEGLTEAEQDAMLEHAFERYYETSGLFGKPETCLTIVDQLKSIGVDEIACLIDFGVATEQVLAHLPYLNEVRERANQGGAKTEPVKQEAFSDLVADHGITHLQCTPSMLRLLIRDDASRQALTGVDHLMIGGEAFPEALAGELRALSSGTITNMYGPTETTIWSTVQPITYETGGAPIGKPIANTEAYVLDQRLQLVPPGLAGELYLAGDGVTRGYLNRPDLTAQRFTPNPFAMGDTRLGARLYRTGDLARFRDNGVLEFLGRVDHQVKVRGFRIEPGEIETRLTRCQGVRESVVVARSDGDGDVRLIAYLVPDREAPSEDDLRTWLRAVFPEYMIPSDFVVLERFPLTPNQKIDRKALPEPGRTRTRTKTVYAAPENELETRITEVWQQVLGRDKIGIDDNFFESGGHSLLAVRMFRQLATIVDKPLALTDLYQYTSIRTLAEFLTSGGDAAQMLQKSMDRAQRRLASRRGRR